MLPFLSCARVFGSPAVRRLSLPQVAFVVLLGLGVRRPLLVGDMISSLICVASYNCRSEE